MTDGKLIETLSEESENIGHILSKSFCDSDLSAWKHVIENTLELRKVTAHPTKFRIRVKEKHIGLYRSASSNRNLFTMSSNSPSRNVSPCNEGNFKRPKEDQVHNRKRVASFNKNYDESIFEIKEAPVNIIRIHKPPQPRRQRKPIKVFRLPRVMPGEEE